MISPILNPFCQRDRTISNFLGNPMGRIILVFVLITAVFSAEFSYPAETGLAGQDPGKTAISPPPTSSPTNPSTNATAYPEGLDRDGLFKAANDYYLNNEPEKALEGYNKLISLGVKNGYLFYNLGNTYFRLGQLGQSILWYERALLYLPRFHDLQVNYDYARGMLADEEFRAPEYSGTLGFLVSVYGELNLRECLLITAGLFWILAGLWIARMGFPTSLRGTWVSIPCWIVGIAFILFCLSSTLKIVQNETIIEAIVRVPAVEVKTGPGEDFSTSFSLHEGTKVRQVQIQGNWVRVLLPSNTSFTGWMPQSTIEAI